MGAVRVVLLLCYVMCCCGELCDVLCGDVVCVGAAAATEHKKKANVTTIQSPTDKQTREAFVQNKPKRKDAKRVAALGQY